MYQHDSFRIMLISSVYHLDHIFLRWQTMQRQLFSINEASKILGMSRSTLYRLIKTKRIASLKDGNRFRRIPVSAIEKYISTQSKKTMHEGLGG